MALSYILGPPCGVLNSKAKKIVFVDMKVQFYYRYRDGATQCTLYQLLTQEGSLHGITKMERVTLIYFIIKNINRSECDHLLPVLITRVKGTVINRRRLFAMKTKSATCFALRDERYASSSRLMVLSLLGCKDGTRTIEMILVSTVLDHMVQPQALVLYLDRTDMVDRGYF